jgi:hypothetical protein
MAGATLKLRRILRRIPPPAITPADAVRIARDECAARGWEWAEPVRVHEAARYYQVATRANTRPNGPWFSVDTQPGQVARAGRPLR